MIKPVLLSLAGLALAAAAPPPPPVPAPLAGLIPPAAVAADPSNKLTLTFSSGGTVTILLRPDLAPENVARVKALTTQGFYNGLKFHRVIPGFMAQGGDPEGTGMGGSPLPDLKAEFTTVPFLRGTVGMARAQEENSANSQFFIMFVPRPELDNKYTVIGRVIAGMDAVDRLAVGEPPLAPSTIVSAKLGN